MVARRGRPLDSADVGRRVVVRHRLRDGRATDVLGELVSWDPHALVVRDRHGQEHHIDSAAIVAAKPVPPAPPRRRGGGGGDGGGGGGAEPTSGLFPSGG